MENATQIEQLDRWGRGEVLHYARAGEDRVLALSTLGVYLYHEATPALIEGFPGATNFLAAVDRNLLLLDYPDGSLRLVDLSNGVVLHTLDPIVTFGMYFCDVCTPEEKEAAMQKNLAMVAQVFSADGSLVAVSFGSGDIGVWDTATGQLRLKLYHEAIGNSYTLQFDPQNNNLYTLNMSNHGVSFVARWLLADGSLAWYVRSPNPWGEIKPSLFSEDGVLFGLFYPESYMNQNYVNLYQVKDGKLVGQVHGTVSDMPYTIDSHKLVATHDSNVVVYQVQPNFAVLKTFWTDFDNPRTIFTADGNISINEGQIVYSAEDYSQIGQGPAPEPDLQPQPIFNPAIWLNLQHLPGALGLDFLSGNDLSVWGSNQPTQRFGPMPVRVENNIAWRWNPLTGSVQQEPYSARLLWNPAFSHDRLWTAACTEAGFEIHRFAAGESINIGRCAAEGAAAFSPDGETMVVSDGNRFRRIRVADGSLLQDFIGEGFGISWMEYSADGTLLATGGKVCGTRCRGDQHLWKVDPPGGVSLQPEGAQWTITDIAFTPDGSSMISAKEYIWMWDAASGALLGRLPGRGVKVAISPNGSLLAVGSADGVITLVSLDSREALIDFKAANSSVTALEFTPDGAGLVLAAQDGDISLWGVRK